MNKHDTLPTYHTYILNPTTMQTSIDNHIWCHHQK